MSRPRQVLPGSTYMVQRRCTQRQFLLTPDDSVNQVFLYSLARAAERTGVLTHCFCVLSNHYHLVITDPDAKLPQFMRDLNQAVARALNVYRKRRESLWESGKTYSAVRLETPESVLEKMVYALANPVAAGLVEFGTEWPGLRSTPEEIGTREFVVERPKFFFGKDKPERCTLRLVVPPEFRDRDHEEFRGDLSAALEAKEEEHRSERHAKNERFEGVDAIRAQSPTDTPETPREALGKLNPRVACRDKWKRVERLALLATFLVKYVKALARYCRGETDVEFPAGTYAMRVRYGVRCEPYAAPT